MGLLYLLAAGYLAKRAHNKLNPPVIVPPPDFDVIGVRARGLREYEIKYRKKAQPSLKQCLSDATQPRCPEDGSFTGTNMPYCFSYIGGTDAYTYISRKHKMPNLWNNRWSEKALQDLQHDRMQ